MLSEILNSSENITLVVLVVWNLVLTGIFWGILRHCRRLVKGVKSGNLEKVLENVLNQLTKSQKKTQEVEELLTVLNKSGQAHFQKMGLVRFNPFAEMGGNQSFSFALLNGEQSGFLITSLHGRSLTRLYVKRIRQGKPVDGKLSKEEELAIKQSVGKGVK